MGFTYKKAGLNDIELLVKTRIEVLGAANHLGDEADMSVVEYQSREYYKEALTAGTHIAYLVFDEKRFIGTGGISFFRVMPTYHNPTGWKAYIMNMYTKSDYRRKGIAYHTLEILVEEAKKRDVKHISLEATDMGRPLYERYGFTKMDHEMELQRRQ
ncbi:MAG: GNAT family N-acetyltransferase [Eubacteriales bacterium]|nr:GNAT family N-acetyltransferase [Eubacteriales bacterium]